MKTILVDTNIILRFLLRDEEKLFSIANKIFLDAETGRTKIYIDEIAVAETLWTLSSFYRQSKKEVIDLLLKLVIRDWVINPRKKIILNALKISASSSLSYIDCWLAEVANANKYKLESFDKKLKKIYVQ